MSTPVGPKGPSDPGLSLGKVLQLRQQQPIEKLEKVESPKLETPPTTTTSDASRFEGSTGTQQALATPVEGAGASQVLARLKARGFEGKKLTKTAETSGPRVVDTTEGKVMSGSVTIESRSGLAKLEGVVRVGGDLTVHEGSLKNADLLALKSLKSVERRLTFEGLSAS